MTNKMPEVYKPYLLRGVGEYELILIFRDHCLLMHPYNPCDVRAVHVSEFWNYFEELTAKTKEEPKLQEKDEVKIRADYLYVDPASLKDKDEVKVALDGLKELLSKECLDESYFRTLENKAQNLVNALDNSNRPQKPVSCIAEYTRKIYGEGEPQIFPIKEEKPKSIWKPIEELPYGFYQIVIKLTNDDIELCTFFKQPDAFKDNCDAIEIRDLARREIINKSEIKEAYLYRDFVTEYESLKSRIERLEENQIKQEINALKDELKSLKDGYKFLSDMKRDKNNGKSKLPKHF